MPKDYLRVSARLNSYLVESGGLPFQNSELKVWNFRICDSEIARTEQDTDYRMKREPKKISIKLFQPFHLNGKSLSACNCDQKMRPRNLQDAKQCLYWNSSKTWKERQKYAFILTFRFPLFQVVENVMVALLNGGLLCIMAASEQLRTKEFYMIWVETVFDLLFTGCLGAARYAHTFQLTLANACVSFYDLATSSALFFPRQNWPE